MALTAALTVSLETHDPTEAGASFLGRSQGLDCTLGTGRCGVVGFGSGFYLLCFVSFGGFSLSHKEAKSEFWLLGALCPHARDSVRPSSHARHRHQHLNVTPLNPNPRGPPRPSS